jgi:hypothetical protein
MASSRWIWDSSEAAHPSCRRKSRSVSDISLSDLLRTTGNEHDVDCRSTSAGYIASILLPPDTADLNITDATPASEYPYTLTLPYEVVTYSMTRPLVMVPIATAFGILAMLLFIGASYMPRTWLDLVRTSRV